MDAYLLLLVSCRLYTTIIRQRKKDFGEIEKIEKYSQRMFILGFRIILCVCVCVCVCVDYICVLLCVVAYVIICMFMSMMIYAPRGRFRVVS